MKNRLLIPAIALIVSLVAFIISVDLGIKLEHCAALAGIFIGMLVMSIIVAPHVKNRKYDGYLQYEVNDEGKEVWTFVINGDPNEWHDYDDILLKVQENPNV